MVAFSPIPVSCTTTRAAGRSPSKRVPRMPRSGGFPGNRPDTRLAATAISGVQRREECRTIRRSGSATVSRNSESAPRNRSTD